MIINDVFPPKKSSRAIWPGSPDGAELASLDSLPRRFSARPRRSCGHSSHINRGFHVFSRSCWPVGGSETFQGWFNSFHSREGWKCCTGQTSFLTPGTQKLPHPHGTQGYSRQTGSYPRDQILLAHWYHAIVGLANKVVKMCPCHCETHI